jgi:mono/diheme cytochrome c family protein
VGESYTDQDWVRAIRHGIGPDRKPLLFMPSHEYNVLTDEDLSALVAYLRSVPPVDNSPAKSTVGPIGRLLFLKGDLHLLPAEIIDHDAPRPTAPVPGPTAEYGAYLSTGCTGCHGASFSGGKIPGTPPEFPPAANITPDPETGIGAWTEADFFRSLREGRRPDGSELAAEMPWQLTRQMTDDEIRAIWLHLRSVPAKAEGGR